jgi:DnaK suppressor protein
MSLSAADLEALKAQLRERAAVLRSEMERKLEETDETRDAGVRGDSGERSFAVAESEVDAGEAQRDQSELGAIERTLARIEEGIYGICVECGADIPVERLRAQPLASRCTNCQSAREARESRFR